MPTLKSIASAGALALLLTLLHWTGGELVPVAHAAGITFPNGTEQAIADIMGKIIIALNVLTWVLFVFLNFLLDPEFIFGGTGGNLLQILNEIWQLARDLMNVIFALILVGAAIYTIITAKKEFLSEHGPKFVMAVVLVNFSWFFPFVVIDVANIGAATVYNIPSLLNNQPNAQCFYTRSTPPVPAAALQCQNTNQANVMRCPCMGVTDVQFFIDTAAQVTAYEGQGYTCPLGQVLCYKQQRLDMNAVAPFSGVLNGLIVNHARLAQLAQVPQPAPNAGPNPTSRMIMFVIKEALVLLIHVALAFPLLAMTIAFLIRIPVLWITMAFMPFYFLDFLMGGTFEQFTQGYGKKILTTFIKAAFLPMLVAVPLTIGLLLLNAATQLTGGALAQVPIRLFDQVNNFWQLLWLCMSLGVIWVGVFSILKGDDIMSTGATTIKGYGESLGRIALKAPLAIPAIPGGTGGQQQSLLGALNRIRPQNIEGLLNSGTPLGQIGNSITGNQPLPQNIQKAAKDLNSNPNDVKALRDAAATAHTDATALITLMRDRLHLGTNNGNVVEQLQQLQKAGAQLNLTPQRIQEIQQGVNKQQADKKAKEDAANKAAQAKKDQAAKDAK